MKALVCAECVDVRALPDRDLVAVVCRCGLSCGWWEDGRRGVARFAGVAPTGFTAGYITVEEAIAAYDAGPAPHPGAPSVFFLGLNNRYLLGAIRQTDGLLDDDGYKALHDAATDAPGYQFDKSRKACWAILLRPGLSSDTRIVTTAPPGLVDRPDWLPIAEPEEVVTPDS